jgi:hypothetical protein
MTGRLPPSSTERKCSSSGSLKHPFEPSLFEPKMHSRSSLDHPARRSRGQSYRQWTILRAQPARYIPCHGTGRAGRCLRKAGLTHCAAASPARGVSAVAIAEPNLARAVHFLPVGQCVTLRPIDPRDADVLQAYVRRLSPVHVIPNACLQGDRGEARPPPYRRLLYFIAQRSNGADPHAPSAPVPFRAGADSNTAFHCRTSYALSASHVRVWALQMF